VATPLETWVNEAAALTKPDRLVYCDGSEAEYQRMTAEMLRSSDTVQAQRENVSELPLAPQQPERRGADGAPDVYLLAGQG